MAIQGRLEGKIAVITGASSGIGRRTAALFAEEGARVTVLDLDEDGARGLIADAGPSVRFFRTDITSEEEVRERMDMVVNLSGSLDILVNCAGIFEEGGVASAALDGWHRIMEVNLTGTFLCMKHAIPHMLARKDGSIINIASEAGIRAVPNQAAYNASKAAVVMLTKSAALDYAFAGIRVNCVCPGRVLTPLVQRVIDESENPDGTLEELSFDRPVMRIGTTLDIARACLVFASDDLKYATGSVLSVDGGYTL